MQRKARGFSAGVAVAVFTRGAHEERKRRPRPDLTGFTVPRGAHGEHRRGAWPQLRRSHCAAGAGEALKRPSCRKTKEYREFSAYQAARIRPTPTAPRTGTNRYSALAEHQCAQREWAHSDRTGKGNLDQAEGQTQSKHETRDPLSLVASTVPVTSEYARPCDRARRADDEQLCSIRAPVAPTHRPLESLHLSRLTALLRVPLRPRPSPAPPTSRATPGGRPRYRTLARSPPCDAPLTTAVWFGSRSSGSSP
jgi:hypothetical protein